MTSAVVVKAQMSDGLQLAAPDGAPMRLVALDQTGEVVAGGRELADALFAAVVAAYENYWAGRGHLTAIQRIEYHN